MARQQAGSQALLASQQATSRPRQPAISQPASSQAAARQPGTTEQPWPSKAKYQVGKVEKLRFFFEFQEKTANIEVEISMRKYASEISTSMYPCPESLNLATQFSYNST